MAAKPEYLLSLCFGPSVLSLCATRWGCTEAAVRVTGILASSTVVGRMIGLTELAAYTGMHYNTCQRAVKECRRLGWIQARNQRHQALRLTVDGLRIAGLLERAEREARVQVQRAELPRWPRSYVRRKVAT